MSRTELVMIVVLPIAAFVLHSVLLDAFLASSEAECVRLRARMDELGKKHELATRLSDLATRCEASLSDKLTRLASIEESLLKPEDVEARLRWPNEVNGLIERLKTTFPGLSIVKEAMPAHRSVPVGGTAASGVEPAELQPFGALVPRAARPAVGEPGEVRQLFLDARLRLTGSYQSVLSCVSAMDVQSVCIEPVEVTLRYEKAEAKEGARLAAVVHVRSVSFQPLSPGRSGD